MVLFTSMGIEVAMLTGDNKRKVDAQMIAALASSISVLLNALRLKIFKPLVRINHYKLLKGF